MAEVRALIAAAGRGTRAGLPYPKTLFELQGRPILLRLLDVLRQFDSRPAVVVSPDGLPLVSQCLDAAGRSAELIIQPEPRGMGDAVLTFGQSDSASAAVHLIVVWGDIPFLQSATISAVVRAHLEHGNDFTLATRVVDFAYTVVTRDPEGRVNGIRETREAGERPGLGERDIGLFIFRKDMVFGALQGEYEGKWGQATGEHGFLPVVAHLARQGARIEALPIATEADLVSLNSLSDVSAYL